MSMPQQPDLARSGRSAVDPSSAKSHAGGPSDESGSSGPVPDDNQPGHHPPVEQDKPTGPPPQPAAADAPPPAGERRGTAKKTAAKNTAAKKTGKKAAPRKATTPPNETAPAGQSAGGKKAAPAKKTAAAKKAAPAKKTAAAKSAAAAPGIAAPQPTDDRGKGTLVDAVAEHSSRPGWDPDDAATLLGLSAPEPSARVTASPASENAAPPQDNVMAAESVAPGIAAPQPGTDPRSEAPAGSPGGHAETGPEAPGMRPAAEAAAGALGITAQDDEGPERPATAGGDDQSPRQPAPGRSINRRDTSKDREDRRVPSSSVTHTEQFEFDFSALLRGLAFPFGVTSRTTSVDVGDGALSVQFGIWRLMTPLDNVTSAEITGPYRVLRVAGPARLSFSDRGITFATTTSRGVCIKFREPVAVQPPFLAIRHPSMTVTVSDPQGLLALLERHIG